MTINNLKPALELWDNGFNVIPVKSKPITPTPENLSLIHISEPTRLLSL